MSLGQPEELTVESDLSMSSLETNVASYRVVIVYDSKKINRLYLGSQSGLDAWPILCDSFKREVETLIFGKPIEVVRKSRTMGDWRL